MEDQQRTVDTVLRLGGRHLEVGQAPDAPFVVLAAPEGNVRDRPGSDFLAGTGYLGEVACDGSRKVGLFWRASCGWPLGWDENQETAVQSPLGGTKLSWRGPPIGPKHGRNRQRFALETDDLDGETERLISLGASLRGNLPDGVELDDPDGNEFSLHADPVSTKR